MLYIIVGLTGIACGTVIWNFIKDSTLSALLIDMFGAKATKAIFIVCGILVTTWGLYKIL
jgi:hypothetical protein